MRRRVAVIFGGRSGEHEVSIRSARSVLAALDPTQWEPIPIGIDRGGGWMTASETKAALEIGATRFVDLGQPLATAASTLAELGGCDVACPLVHGTYGEDGTLPGLLELLDVAYTGPGIAASAVGMDKVLMKAIFRDAGVPVAPHVVFRAGDDTESTTAHAFVEEGPGYPCFVKPSNGGSSVGVSQVRSREDLASALQAAFTYDEKALVEAAIRGREVECSVLGNEAPRVSVVGEIEPDREFYDYASKYDDRSTTTLHIPARLPAAQSKRIRELAVRGYQAVGAEGYARMDFFACEDGSVVANEINTVPGFTSISMYPKLWEASGVPYAELLSRILELGIERWKRRSRR